MVSQVPAEFTPEVLLWARETLGLDVDEAAKRIGIAVDRLAGAEAGKAPLSVPQLRKAADLYRRPLAVFLLDQPPRDPPSLPDFRRFPKGIHKDPSWKLRLQIRKAQELRQAAIRLADFGPKYEATFQGSVSLDDSPEKTGSRIRSLLALSEERLAAWTDKYKAFNGWREAIERQGVLVFLVSRVPLREMRGFSLPGSPYPAIVLNRADDPAPRTFTLIHEFCHLLLNRPALCNSRIGSFLRTPPPSDTEIRVEIFCNYVAGAALAPRSALEAHDVVARHPIEQKRWGDDELAQLANYLKVSREVVYRRLVIIGRASREAYKERRELWNEEAKRTKSTSRPSEKGHIRVLRTHGHPYVRLVLEALHGEAITASDASSLLDMKLRHLSALEETAGSR